jgi:two-component sensor histidine kinase
MQQRTADAEKAAGHSLPADAAAEHRRQTRSLVAQIRAIVRRTSAGASSVTDFVAHLNGRLDAIARMQEILMRDTAQEVDLCELLADEFHRQGIDSASVETPSSGLRMDKRVAASMALALHELATNAIKFGQIGMSSRRIRVGWCPSATPGWMTFTWREDALSPDDTLRKTAGFGFELIRSTLPYEMGARTRIDLDADGLVCEIEFCPRSTHC